MPNPTVAPVSSRPIWYQDVRIHTRLFCLHGHLRRYRFQLRPGPTRRWVDLDCTNTYLTRQEAQEAAKRASPNPAKKTQ